MLENPVRDLELRERRVSLDFRPFEVKTLLFRKSAAVEERRDTGASATFQAPPARHRARSRT